MNHLRNAVVALLVVLFCAATSAQAQIYVNVRPVVPRYERVVAPSPRHVWIDEEWEPRGGAYVFVGGHWALPPRPGMFWMPGHWRETPRGHMWTPGHWRHR